MCQAVPETLKRVFEEGYRAVVLTGRGAVFSAGVDLFRILDGGPDYTDRLVATLSEALLALFRFPLPIGCRGQRPRYCRRRCPRLRL